MAVNLVTKLVRLAQLDADTVAAYEKVTRHLEVPLLYRQLGRFREDHARHIELLGELIRDLGAEPYERLPDLRGLLLKSTAAMRSLTGTEGALRAIRAVERVATRAYRDTVTAQVPLHIREPLVRHLDDERRHLFLVEQILRERTWEYRAGV